MPALAPVPGVVRFAFRGTAAGVACVNTFHVRAGIGPVDQTLLNAMTSSIKAAYETNLVPRLNGTWSGDTVTGVDLSSSTGVVSTQALGGSPGATDLTSPNSLACCITWKIPRQYRGGHPRTYLGPIARTSLENGTTFNATALTGFLTGASAFLTAVNGINGSSGTCRLVAVHRYQNGTQLIPPEVSLISSAAVDGRIDTMRRRLGKDR